jgi:hypothetical protein
MPVKTDGTDLPEKSRSGLIVLAARWILPLLLPAAAQATAENLEADHSIFFQQVDVSFAVPSGVTASLSYTPTFRLFGRRLNAGIGGRFSSFFGGQGVVFPNGDAALIAAGAKDTLTVDQPRSFALNLMFAVSVRLFAGLEAGMNIDLLGVGFGPSVTGRYAGSEPGSAGPQEASPSRLNLLLLGRHDHGQLDSEFFAAYWFDSWGVRVGVSHMSTEYTTSRPLDGNNDRFRASATRAFAALAYRF